MTNTVWSTNEMLLQQFALQYEHDEMTVFYLHERGKRIKINVLKC